MGFSPKASEDLRNVQVNVMMSQSERDLITELTAYERVSAAQVVRAAIYARHAMIVKGVPNCASGARCIVPHMHAPALAGGLRPATGG